MGVMERYAAGIGNQGSYMVSGQPFITGSKALAAGVEDRIVFPFVTKRITVMASGSLLQEEPTIRVSFASTGSSPFAVVQNHHYVQLDGDEEAFSFNCKCKEIFIHPIAGKANSGYKIFAELTRIGIDQMYHLTGSGIRT